MTLRYDWRDPRPDYNAIARFIDMVQRDWRRQVMRLHDQLHGNGWRHAATPVRPVVRDIQEEGPDQAAIRLDTRH
jgi:hypothetical protein